VLISFEITAAPQIEKDHWIKFGTNSVWSNYI